MRVVRVTGHAPRAVAALFDVTTFSAHANDEHRRMEHEGEIRTRVHYRELVAVVLGPGECIAVSAIAVTGENAGVVLPFVPLA